jgi:hypothetical protein
MNKAECDDLIERLASGVIGPFGFEKQKTPRWIRAAGHFFVEIGLPWSKGYYGIVIGIGRDLIPYAEGWKMPRRQTPGRLARNFLLEGSDWRDPKRDSSSDPLFVLHFSLKRQGAFSRAREMRSSETWLGRSRAGHSSLSSNASEPPRAQCRSMHWSTTKYPTTSFSGRETRTCPSRRHGSPRYTGRTPGDRSWIPPQSDSRGYRRDRVAGSSVAESSSRTRPPSSLHPPIDRARGATDAATLADVVHYCARHRLSPDLRRQVGRHLQGLARRLPRLGGR